MLLESELQSRDHSILAEGSFPAGQHGVLFSKEAALKKTECFAFFQSKILLFSSFFFFSPAVEDNCFVLRKWDFDWNLPVSEFWPQFSGAHLVLLVYTHHIFINIVQMSCLRPLPERYGLTYVSECSSESGSLITLARCSAACFWGAYADGA